jgi:predicted Rossmann fold nucleotide-binding protein DprA/Smf involved in DNA uptake
MTCGVGIEQQLSLPLARRSDPETSHAAAVRVVEFSAGHHAAIIAALRDGPATIYGIAERTRLEVHAVARRLPELARAGQVAETGTTAPSPSGRECRVWKAAP